MITAPVHNLNGVKVEDVTHLGNMVCDLRLLVQPSHGQLMLVHSRLQPSAGCPNVVAPSAAALKSVDNGRNLLLESIMWGYVTTSCRVCLWGVADLQKESQAAMLPSKTLPLNGIGADCRRASHLRYLPPAILLILSRHQVWVGVED
nr:unnamed protein product [Spirometra erinaceieuropaei]